MYVLCAYIRLKNIYYRQPQDYKEKEKNIRQCQYDSNAYDNDQGP